VSIQEYAELIDHLNHTKWFSAKALEARRWKWRDEMQARLVHLIGLQILKKPPSTKDLMATHPDTASTSSALKDIEKRIAEAAARKRRKD
jgi:hypothetical protein